MKLLLLLAASVGASDPSALRQLEQASGLPISRPARQEQGPARCAGLQKLVVIHTNDIHGQLGPLPADPPKGLPASGGAASLAALVKGEGESALYFDAGDWYQGTPEGNLTKGRAMIEAFNAIGLDAAVLGNHEFDYGIDNLKALIGRAEFPVLLTNAAEGGGAGLPAVKTALIRRPCFDVGVFGLLTRDMPNLVPAELQKGLALEDELEAARKAVAALRAQGAEVIVALTHVGLESDGSRHTGIVNGDIALARKVPGIDLILGGHTHTPLKEPIAVGSVLILQNGGQLRTAGRAELSVDPAKGVVARSARSVALDPGLYPPDPEVAAIVARHQEAAQAELGRPLGSAALALTRSNDGESLAGNWIMDVMRRAAGTELALMNTFGIRADLPAGPLTYGDVYKVMPFDNLLATFEITGAELRKVVEYAVGEGAILVQFLGLEYAYDRGRPAGTRVVTVTTGGTPLQDDRTYLVAAPDFVVFTDKALKGVKTARPLRRPELLRDLMTEDVAKRSPITQRLEGRARPATKGDL